MHDVYNALLLTLTTLNLDVMMMKTIYRSFAYLDTGVKAKITKRQQK